MILPAPSALLAMPLRSVSRAHRQAPACRHDRARGLSPSCVSCRFPACSKVLLWVVAILASLVALANAANIISNRFVLPYTSGAVCNKSSVAAMLGVMDNVAPYQGENEFPDDIPFDTYFGEQKRRAEEMARAGGRVCRGPAAKRLRQHH